MVAFFSVLDGRLLLFKSNMGSSKIRSRPVLEKMDDMAAEAEFLIQGLS
jgi:hypothetical protein